MGLEIIPDAGGATTPAPAATKKGFLDKAAEQTPRPSNLFNLLGGESESEAPVTPPVSTPSQQPPAKAPAQAKQSSYFGFTPQTGTSAQTGIIKPEARKMVRPLLDAQAFAKQPNKDIALKVLNAYLPVMSQAERDEAMQQIKAKWPENTAPTSGQSFMFGGP